jgi:hypothetical protein
MGLASLRPSAKAHTRQSISSGSPLNKSPPCFKRRSRRAVKMDDLADQLRTSSEAVVSFFKILQEEDVPVAQLQTKLTPRLG